MDVMGSLSVIMVVGFLLLMAQLFSHNNSGRQLDGAVGSLEMLPEIVEAVGEKLTVIFDSGIRTGVDIIKALSLGAKAVLVGRPAIYGLAIGGKVGCNKKSFDGMLTVHAARCKTGVARPSSGS
jgi:hypothetical protein